MSNKQFRINQFFRNSKRALIVALDHGLMMGSMKGIENLNHTISKLIKTPIDGMLISPVSIEILNRDFPDSNIPLILTIDYGLFPEMISEGSKEFLNHRILWQVEDALKHDAQAVKMFLNFSDDSDLLMRNIESLSGLVKQADHWNMPVMVEVLFMDNRKFKNGDKQKGLLKDACRIAYELGADILKVPIIQQEDVYQEIKDHLDLPVFVLGGSKIDDREMEDKVKSMMNQGVSGAVFGRNIWQSDSMEILINRLAEIIHN